jgi:hypothetical protein
MSTIRTYQDYDIPFESPCIDLPLDIYFRFFTYLHGTKTHTDMTTCAHFTVLFHTKITYISPTTTHTPTDLTQVLPSNTFSYISYTTPLQQFLPISFRSIKNMHKTYAFLIICQSKVMRKSHGKVAWTVQEWFSIACMVDAVFQHRIQLAHWKENAYLVTS